MFKGFLLSESLEDPLILNRWPHEYVRVQRQEEAAEEGYPLFWHLFKVLIEDDEIEAVAAETANSLKKPGWYAHFWDGEVVVVCFPDRVFRMPQEEKSTWSSPEFIEVREYAIQIGIGERYLDFLVEP